MNAPKFKVKQRIAKGGMASVYLAVQESLGRRVALKLMRKFDNPKQAERFLHEGRIIASLSHRNIITIHDVGVIGDRHFISMEYLEGGSLEDRIGKEGMPPNKALSILEQIAGCLRFVHRKGIVHRDIKPGNILFHSDGTPKLTDFGIAKLLDSDQDLTTDGAALGSPYYLSPEQAEGRPLDGRTDIYALGIVFYQMLTGEKPFAKGSPIETIVAHLTQPIPLLPDELSGYQPLLERMIAKNPEDRVGSAKELVYMIRELRRSPPEPLPHTRSNDGTSGVTATVRRLANTLFTSDDKFSLPKTAAVAAGVLAVVVGGVLLTRSDDSAELPDQASVMSKSDTAVATASTDVTATKPSVTAAETAIPEAFPTPPATDTSQPVPQIDLPQLTSASSEQTPAATDTTPSDAIAQTTSADNPVMADSSPAATSQLADEQPSIDDTLAMDGGETAEQIASEDANETADALPENETAGVDTPASPRQDAAIADTAPDKADQIKTLMNAARTALERNRLTTPAKDNAYSYFEQILEINPEHKAARSGKQIIVERYADLALGAMRAGNERRAQIYLRRGLKLQPRNKALLAAREEMITIREARIAAAQQAPEPVISVAEPVPAPSNREDLRGREGSGNIVKDFKRVWRAIFD